MMFEITLICVGKMKERYYTDAAEEYRKRLSGHSKIEIIEIPEYRLPGNPSVTQIDEALRKECESIRARLPGKACTAALCIEGREFSSTDFSGFLCDFAQKGISRIAFIIGGSYGLHDEIKAAADVKISMSKMTFPHHLSRVMILEQLYRAFSIAEGWKYHK